MIVHSLALNLISFLEFWGKVPGADATWVHQKPVFYEQVKETKAEYVDCQQELSNYTMNPDICILSFAFEIAKRHKFDQFRQVSDQYAVKEHTHELMTDICEGISICSRTELIIGMSPRYPF